ncbi:MAG: VTT domain-containing protein [Chloroflexi bacterium]|nr:VTT domain-containing protein [Chloroflexota bacterium]
MEDTTVKEPPQESSRFFDLDLVQQQIRIGRFRMRLEYILLGLIAVLAVSMFVGFIVFNVDFESTVDRWGYPALWLISGLRAASVVLPIPGSGLTIAAGAFMDPLFGIPVPIAVGVTAGSAESLGEFTGYAAGYGGGRILDKQKLYQRVKAWIRKRAFVTILVMGLTPSPVFDVAGLAAGASRVPIRIFWPAVLIGKITRGIIMAAAGFYGIEFIQKIV